MTSPTEQPTVTVDWNELLMLEHRIRYAKRHLCEAVMFAHGDVLQHIDRAYIDLVRATEGILQLIKGNQDDDITAPS